MKEYALRTLVEDAFAPYDVTIDGWIEVAFEPQHVVEFELREFPWLLRCNLRTGEFCHFGNREWHRDCRTNPECQHLIKCLEACMPQ